MKRINALPLSSKEKSDLRKPATKELAHAQKLYQQQLLKRAKYMLKPKRGMTVRGLRRYLIPTDAPGYTKWKAKKDTHQVTTVTMDLPTAEQLEKDSGAGGVKNEQYYPFGTPEHKHGYGLRNTVESANRNAKRSQFEDLADPNKRTARGNTFTYIVIALALVSENLRQAVSFFKRRLVFGTLTSKNTYVPEAFWQSEGLLPARR